jgi:pantoate--beta-alanine ligase
MLICRTPSEMHAACRYLRNARRGGSRLLGLVPTMGALHAGHMSLVAAARAECEVVTASIFVNPTQFSPGEDYETYPRTFDDDCRQLEAAGVDLLFAPTAAEMYPAGNVTFIDPGPIALRLDGASRPNHFRGVATIVARLFHVAAPDRAYFGQKDAAQIAVIRSITRDLNFPTHIVACPTIREPDGLAMSSRNRYLSPEERARALILFRALDAANDIVIRNTAAHRKTTAEALCTAMRKVFITLPTLNLDYAAIVDPHTLLPVPDISRGALLAAAAWIGETRLIDNILVPPPAQHPLPLSS